MPLIIADSRDCTAKMILPSQCTLVDWAGKLMGDVRRNLERVA